LSDVSIAAPPPVSEKIRASFWIFVSLAGIAAGITCLYLGMRAVMEIGGACAEGGPYEIRQPCPKGVPMLILGGLWGGIACVGVYLFQTIKHSVPSFLGLIWPALFLSLGWNFLEFGLNPPGADTGVAVGWLVCAVLFGIMGAVPLFAVLGAMVRSFTRDEQPPSAVDSIKALGNLRPSRSSGWKSKSSSPYGTTTTTKADTSTGTTTSTTASSEGLVDELERLAALHRSGALGADEYAAAKRRLLEGG
jgi:hypothetical protein